MCDCPDHPDHFPLLNAADSLRRQQAEQKLEKMTKALEMTWKAVEAFEVVHGGTEIQY